MTHIRKAGLALAILSVLGLVAVAFTAKEPTKPLAHAPIIIKHGSLIIESPEKFDYRAEADKHVYSHPHDSTKITRVVIKGSNNGESFEFTPQNGKATIEIYYEHPH